MTAAGRTRRAGRFAARLSAIGGLAIALLSGAPARPAAARADGRVVAIGDVHGSDDGFLAMLQAAGLVDQAGHWSGGTATLVQTGDVTDRGAGVKRVLDLVRALVEEAPKAGGRVVPVLGNHEVMNLLGELRDVTPAICASFASASAEAIGEKAWADYLALVARRARQRRGENPPALNRTRESFLQSYQRGCIEYRLAFSAQGEYGKWLRDRPIAVNVQGTVFMHAGASPLADPVTLEQMNSQARDEVRRFDRFLERLVRADLAEPWFRLEDVVAVAAAEVRWTSARIADGKARGEAPDLGDIDIALVRDAAEFLGIDQWSLLASDGPLWYRGYATAEEATLDAPFTALLKFWNAERLVVGHTPAPPFRIRARLQGRLFLIDTGMLTPVYKGTGSALEFDTGRVTALYADGTRLPLVPMPAAP